MLDRMRHWARRAAALPARHRWLKSRPVLFGAAFVLLLLAIALWPRAIEVDLAVVRRGMLSVTVDEEGETRVRERYVVSAPVSGEIRRIELEPGDPVEAGRTVLAQLRPSSPTPLDARLRAEAEAQVLAAQAALKRSRAEHARTAALAARAQQQYERLQRLSGEGAVSRDALDAQHAQARAASEALQSAEFAVAQSEHELGAARARLIEAAPGADRADIPVLAPVDGLVLKRYRESRTVVPAGEPLLELGDVRELEIVSDLLSSDAVRVSAGDAVLIEQWGGGRTLRGRVRRVEPAGFLKISALGVEEQRVNVIVDFIDPAQAASELGDAYRVEVRIVVWEQADTLKVPVGALFRQGDDWAVFVAEGRRARLRRIELGHRNSEEAQVLSGLGAGDRTVLYPPDELQDGARIVARRPGRQ